MMNQRTNKKRSTSSRGGRGKVVERQLSVEGVYGNHRFMQTVGNLVGLPVQVLTKTKETYNGVLTTFSPNFELVLDLPHLVLNEESSLISNPESIKRKMIFSVKDIVIIKAANVDLEYATRESFAVDNVISKYNGQLQTEKELEPWNSEEAAYADLELGDENANGWDADDMFKKNEEKYGVTTTYSPDLEGYTTPLQKRDTKEWKEQQAKANKVALQIEHSPIAQTRAEVENGEDEEEKFSMVIRPDQGSSGKYMPPQRRKIQGGGGGGNSKQPPRGTPSPQSAGGGPPPMSSGGGRYNSHSSSSASAPYSNNSSQSSSMSSSASGPPMGSPYPPQQNQMKHHPHNKHNNSQQLPASGSGHHQHSNQRDPKLNGDPKDSRRHDNSHSYVREPSVHKDSYHSHHGPQSQHSHQQQYSHQSYQQQQQQTPQQPPQQQQPQPPLPPQQQPQQHQHHPQLQHQQPHHPSAYHPPDNRRSEPREQREPRKPRNQKEEQQLADLKKFSQDFKLSETNDKKGPQQNQQQPIAPQSQTQAPNQSHITSVASTPVPTTKHHHSPHQIQQQSSINQGVSQPTPSQVHQQQQPQQQQQQQQNIPSSNAQRQSSTPESHSINSSGSSTNSSSGNSLTSQQQSQSSQSQQPPPPPQASQPSASSNAQQTPTTPQEKSNEEDKHVVTQSTLNPNAKEFMPNLNSKIFSPRSPSTTTPPRVQTPQMAPSQSQIGSGVPSVGFQQNLVHAYVMQPFPVQSQQRFPKRGPVNNQRTDYTSSMQVAAATGHPILAPAPLTSITSPQSIPPAVQIPQNMMPQTHQPYQYQGVPMMLRLPPPGIPMVTTMVPTSMNMYYQGGEGHQNSQGGHTPQHMYVAPGVPPHQAHQPHHSATPGPHPGQPPTPQGHNNAGGGAGGGGGGGPPAPPPNIPTQPPTPGPTPPQAMMYSGGPTGAPIGGQPTIPQHLQQHSPHTGQSPHNPYTNPNAVLAAAAAAAAAAHHPQATQLVMLPPHMTPHMMPPAAPPPPHSGAGHAPSSAAGYTPTSSAAAAMQHLNHGHPVHYIPGTAGSQVHSIPLVHHNQ